VSAHELGARGARTQKVCFLLRIDPARLDEYIELHERVWPEMLDALRDSGYRNYSMFADETGLLVGYLETDDFDATLAAMNATQVNREWSESIGGMFRPVDARRPVDAVEPLRHVFDLDEQLRRADR
jgi:L-rhamnose mutarotase